MWFKFSLSLLNSDVYAELSLNEKRKHTNYDSFRQIAFISLLAACADGCEFSDAKSLADRFGLPLIQAQRVWSVCMAFGVLTQTESGRYTAAPWMRGRGMLGKDEKKETACRPKHCAPNKPPKCSPTTPQDAETSPTSDRTKDIAALFGGLNFKPNKKD